MSLATDLAPAISALRSGGVIACPTEAVWGFSCDPENDAALAHLMRMKERDPAFMMNLVILAVLIAIPLVGSVIGASSTVLFFLWLSALGWGFIGFWKFVRKGA